MTLLFSNNNNTNYALGQISDNLLEQNNSTELKIQDLFSQTSKSVVQITVIDPLSNAQQALGSGFLYDKDGHIITNNHVVAFNEGNNNYLVTFSNGNSYQAKLIGHDPYSDLAVLKLDPIDIVLSPIPLGNSSSLRVGDTVAAIGNPFGLSGSLTVGIVSGLGRLLPSTEGSTSPFSQFAMNFNIPDIIQTDAAINPGNSGGPLLNLKGEVIGINSAIFSNTGVNAGIGFAVPSNTVKKVVQSIISSGKYLHPYLGVVGMDITPQLAKIFGLKESKGFLITDITPGSPAAKSGKLQKGTITYNQRGEIIDSDGDIIVAIDDKEVRKIDDILTYLEREKEVGDTVTLKILRNDKLENVEIVLAPRVSEESAVLQQYDKKPVPKQDDFLAQCYQFLPKSLCDLLR
ncbi:MAG: trypsin-like peptidase domain-containing protein [Nitrososphaeraceae archaeon]|nr:trypsin-like peptidase domain-containing protein [Nitrososphaeraceae archaeon]MDW3610799.1 trypsin-like peptidase domain-containing protein [Nitrososphaeraceae archaeon]